ncbi:MAG TPA: YhjD/YihY/BrkB family envelope integrity protein [Polyangiaceae bacterium]|jgi:membrane protein
MRAGRAWVAQAREWLDPMWADIARARTLGLAAEMSFWLFLSLVPLAAVAGLVAAKLATQRAGVAGSLLSAVPPDARAMVTAQVTQVAQWSGKKVAPVAIGMFLWLAASGVHSIFDALEVQAASERPWWQKRALAIATCIGLSIGVAILGVIAVGLGWLETVAGRAVPHAPLEGTIAGFVVRSVLGLLIATGMVAALYRIGIPRAARSRVPVLPGALFAVALITALGWGYRVYVSATGTGDAYRGSLAVIGITLMTLWLFSLALLLGAELNKVAADRRSGHCAADDDVARVLRKVAGKWPTSDDSSYQPTSPTPPRGPSIGPLPSPSASALRSR